MVLKLYKMDLSPPSRAAMMLCEILNIPVEHVNINLGKQEHMSPEFLKINPGHTIPVLVDGELVIQDSHAILMYLVDTYGNNSALYPKDVKQRALVNQKLFFNNAVLFGRMRNVTYPAILEGVKGLTERKVKDIDEAYQMLEAFLSNAKYLAGNNLTIADIASCTTVAVLNHIVPLKDDKYPKLSAWLKEIRSKPYFQKYGAPGDKEIGDILKKQLN